MWCLVVGPVNRSFRFVSCIRLALNALYPSNPSLVPLSVEMNVIE